MNAMTGNATRETPPWVNDLTKHPLVTARVKDIATHLFERIAAGEFPFGTRIPAERDLAQSYGESRATIRQALDFLSLYGAVARRAGSGTFVSYAKPEGPAPKIEEDLPGYLNIDQLAENASPFAANIAMSILAPEMVRIATIYMSNRDIAILRGQLTRLETIVTESAMFGALEDDIMMTIARGTHNSLITAMYSILHEVRRRPQWATSRQQTLTPAKMKNVQMLMRSLYNAIERRNVETAIEIIKLYVANNHEEMLYES
ncbi:FadR/GntR family transcriptional regulator [Hyphomicrobium methylovorum]|uniref:FadR/GntR family transcriptional regulator n=1 Tax=Hyphomicrobium methylovorum TaxID=84 RepID=UPI001FE86818|nr:GntR family transcriptional regulator [Hyphomicrobium methylovorum]